MDGTDSLLPAKGATAASRLFTLVGIVVVVAGLYLGRRVLIPLALAVVFAFLLTPVVALVERTRIGRLASVLTVLLLSFALFAFLGWGVTNQLVEVLARLPDYKENIHDKIEAIRTPGVSSLSKATATVNDIGKELVAKSETAATNSIAGAKKNTVPIAVQVATPPRSASEYLRDSLGPISEILETAGIVVIFTLFILIKREDLRNRLFRLVGETQLNTMTQALDEASQRLGRYLLMQFAVNAGYGLLFGLGLWLIGVPHALLWGVLGTLLRFVPYIGTAVAAAFPIGMALAIFPGWSQVVLVFVLFLCLELILANLIEPWLYGAHTGISPLALLVSAIVWGMLWGPVGLILSTPLTVCLVLIGTFVPQLNFLPIILGDEPVLTPQAHFYQRLLALDDGEAKDIATRYLQENPLDDLYDTIVIPALGLAERDRHADVLDETKTRFVYQATRDLIEELYEDRCEAAESAGDDSSGASEETRENTGSRIVCIPARDEADEIVAIMLAQLLRHRGWVAEAVPITSVSTMLDKTEEFQPDLICVSALPPFAAVQAKSLCRLLRQRCRKTQIVLGLWQYPGGLTKAQERVGIGCADLIGTSLAQIVSLVAQQKVSIAAVGSGDRVARIPGDS